MQYNDMPRLLASSFFLSGVVVLLAGCGGAQTQSQSVQPVAHSKKLTKPAYGQVRAVFLTRKNVSSGSQSEQTRACSPVPARQIKRNSIVYALYASCLAQMSINAQGRAIRACYSVEPQSRLECLAPLFSGLAQSLNKSAQIATVARAFLAPGPCYDLLFKANADRDLGQAAQRMYQLLTTAGTTPEAAQSAAQQLESAGKQYDQASYSSLETLQRLPAVCQA